MGLARGMTGTPCPICATPLRRADAETCSKTCGLVLRARRNAAQPLASAKKAVSADLEAAIQTLLERQPATLRELSSTLDRSEASIAQACAAMRERGLNLDLRGERATLSDTITASGEVHHNVDVSHFGGNTYRIGVLGDNHAGSKHSRYDAVEALYDIFQREGIADVYHTGNWIEGEKGKMNFHDIDVFGMGDQVDHFIRTYPQRPGLTTYVVSGDDHEGWYVQRERVDIGRYMEMQARHQGRTDLVNLGYVEADVALIHPDAPENQKVMRVAHPGGGSSYALSYAAQKYIESLQGGEKPSVFLYGHYHKYDANYYREVYTLGTGCLVDQSIFMRKNKIQAHVGGLIVEITQAPDGTLTRFRHEWFPFYNKRWYALGSPTGDNRNFVAATQKANPLTAQKAKVGASRQGKK